MAEPTVHELVRRIEVLENNTVNREVYVRDIKEFRADIAEIKKGTNRLIAMVITETIALMAAVVVVLVQQTVQM
ncbi:MAG TPA: hypothetical protein VK966_02925 [Longimicrobiales bacterium]|nr:hypothetical protein [Longimicrobiales bacterium]